MDAGCSWLLCLHWQWLSCPGAGRQLTLQTEKSLNPHPTCTELLQVPSPGPWSLQKRRRSSNSDSCPSDDNSPKRQSTLPAPAMLQRGQTHPMAAGGNPFAAAAAAHGSPYGAVGRGSSFMYAGGPAAAGPSWLGSTDVQELPPEAAAALAARAAQPGGGCFPSFDAQGEGVLQGMQAAVMTECAPSAEALLLSSALQGQPSALLAALSAPAGPGPAGYMGREASSSWQLLPPLPEQQQLRGAYTSLDRGLWQLGGSSSCAGVNSMSPPPQSRPQPAPAQQVAEGVLCRVQAQALPVQHAQQAQQQAQQAQQQAQCGMGLGPCQGQASCQRLQGLLLKAELLGLMAPGPVQVSTEL